MFHFLDQARAYGTMHDFHVEGLSSIPDAILIFVLCILQVNPAYVGFRAKAVARRNEKPFGIGITNNLHWLDYH